MSVETIVFIKDFIWAPLIGLVGWGWHHVNKRSDDLASRVDKQEEDMRLHIDERHTQAVAHADQRMYELKLEVDRQRDVSAKIFDKLEVMQKRGEDRHLELLNALHTGLSTKADK